jgi:hypothetical protein
MVLDDLDAQQIRHVLIVSSLREEAPSQLLKLLQ